MSESPMANEEEAKLKAEVARLTAESAAFKSALTEVDGKLERMDCELEKTRTDLACALAGAGKCGKDTFHEAGVEVLSRLLRFAHERSDAKTAALVAQGACCTKERAKEAARCDEAALFMRYLAPLDDEHTKRCVMAIVRKWPIDTDMRGHSVCNMVHELGIRALHYLLRALPADQLNECEPQEVELSVPNLRNLPAEMPWQLSGDVKWRMRVAKARGSGSFLLGVCVSPESSCFGRARDMGLASHPELRWKGPSKVRYYDSVDHSYGSPIDADKIPRDEPLLFKGRFGPVTHRSRWFLLREYLRAAHTQVGDIRALEHALGGGMAAEAAAAGCNDAAVDFIRDVALRDCAHRFTDLAADPAFTSLSASTLRRLLERNELNTETEEETLLALGPWLSAEGRQAADVAEALGTLRWAFLPREVISMQLAADGGMLAPWAEEQCIKELIEAALESHWSAKSNLKRSREEEEDLTCPITHVLLEDPVFTADGHTYERAAIQAHFNTGKMTSPSTNKQLPNTSLTPNLMVKKHVSALRERTQRAGLRKRARFAASSPAA